MATQAYDLLVIGSGAAGLPAAIQGARLGARVALVERDALLGGAAINTGTIPSKALREAALYLSGSRRRLLVEEGFVHGPGPSIPQVMARCLEVQRHEHELITARLAAHNVAVIRGDARFSAANRISISGRDEISAEKIVIAVGTKPYHPQGVSFDGARVLDSDQVLRLGYIPRSLAVVGAGVIGCEYASIFAAIGVNVLLIDGHAALLEFADREIVDALRTHLGQGTGMRVLLGETIGAIDQDGDGVRLQLGSGESLTVENVLYCAGRVACTDSLNLAAVGLLPEEHGHLKVDSNYQTAVPGIYAAGDVIGFPALAATSMDQGRAAALHALGVTNHNLPTQIPYGIYTIPEISMVGRTEEQVTQAGVAYETGRAYYRDIARGQILGDETGFMKVIFRRDTRELLGVHIIGEGATELVHLGQAVMNFSGSLDYLRDAVFNYPTLAEGYKIAALDGFNRLQSRSPHEE